MVADQVVDGEMRWRTIGEVDGESLLLVIHLYGDDEEDEIEVVRIISARETTPQERRRYEIVYELKPDTPLTEKQREMLKALKSRPIDLSDAPELPKEAWKNVVRGRFYRPVKQAVSLRLDADVLAWFKKDGDGYQTRVNQMLRERMLEELNKAG